MVAARRGSSVTGVTCDAAGVDALVAAVGLRLGEPAINRRDVVLVTGPWLAGVSSVVGALRDRLPQHIFIEAAELAPGDAPVAVVFVVSAAAELVESDCALLDVAAEHTDVVTGVVSKIDVHRTWREVLTVNRHTLAAHAPRYRAVPWVGVAASPDVGNRCIDDLVATVRGQLADSAIARRNGLRAWESWLQMAAQRFERDAEGAGRRARVDALREKRSAVLRQRRRFKSQCTIALRSQVQQARVQLSYFARNRCSAIRAELQEDVSRLSPRDLAGFEAHARGRASEVVAEVGESTVVQLADIAAVVGMPVDLAPPEELPDVVVSAPPLKSRRLETRLMMLLGAGFGLGVALTLSRLVADVAPGLTAAGAAAGMVAGLAITVWVIKTRGLLHDRALLDRWAGDMTTSLRSVVEQLVASRVLVAELALSTALAVRDEAEHTQAAGQIGSIDAELREHASAAARAAVERDREMPMVKAALDAVRAELGERDASAER